MINFISSCLIESKSNEKLKFISKYTFLDYFNVIHLLPPMGTSMQTLVAGEFCLLTLVITINDNHLKCQITTSVVYCNVKIHLRVLF